MPDLTIVLDCPAVAGLKRARQRPTAAALPDRFEGQQVDFHDRVRNGFIAIARAEPGRVKVIDSDRPLEIVAREIADTVEEYFRC